MITNPQKLNIAKFDLPVSPPEEALSPEAKDFLSQKPLNEGLVEFSGSKGAQIAMTSLAIIGVFSVIASSFSCGCLNLGQSFMKLFLVIKIIGKCIFFPIRYKGILLNTLYSMALLSGHF